MMPEALPEDSFTLEDMMEITGLSRMQAYSKIQAGIIAGTIKLIGRRPCHIGKCTSHLVYVEVNDAFA